MTYRLLALLTASAAWGLAEAELPEKFNEDMPLFEKALGDFSRPISSDNEEAQAYFDQGFQMKYAFAVQDATRSFREAWKRDPECAICYWGEAWGWGSYLNGPMPLKHAPFANAAIQKAAELAPKHASEKEQALIEAMTVRYPKEFEDEKRREYDEAYAAAMGKIYERYPNDLDVATIYAEALFLLEPRRGDRKLEDPGTQRLLKVLEKVLDADIQHAGACHFYIHATEATPRPELAEPCTEFVGSAIPGASHMNHMPSHTWNEIGRWGDSVRANLQAWHSDLKAEIGEGFAIYPMHNLHMLLFAASMDGQGAIAIQAGRDYGKLTGNRMYEATTLIRFGRFDEVFEMHGRPKDDPIQQGYWDFAQGYAHLRAGEPDFAQAYLNRLLDLTQTDAKFRGHPACDLLGVLAGILEGEIRRGAGDIEGALRSFEWAAALDDQLRYDEPEPLPFSAWHWLGAALLEDGQFAEAEKAYRWELKDHPHNGWSLFGLLQALEAQGKTDPAVEADWEASWARSDTWIRGSRF